MTTTSHSNEVVTGVSHAAPFGCLRDINSPIPLHVTRLGAAEYFVVATNGEKLIVSDRGVMFLQDVGNGSIVVELNVESAEMFPARIDLYFDNDDGAYISVGQTTEHGGVRINLVTEVGHLQFTPRQFGDRHV